MWISRNNKISLYKGFYYLIKNSESFGIKITKILTDSSYFILIVLHAGVKIADQQQ